MKIDINRKFYDELSQDYRLIFDDWSKTVEEQGVILDNIIKKYSSVKNPTILDCSCGIGTQCLGLAQLGYKVTATDLSPKAVELAKEEADKRGLNITFNVADFTKLKEQVLGFYDCIITCDNSIPHLLTNELLYLALSNIYSKLNNSGLFICSIRDYDKLLNEKPTNTNPSIKKFDQLRTISFQIWDWSKDNTYCVNHFTLKGHDDNYQTYLRKTYYRAYQRDEISRVLSEVGFQNIIWLMPEESGYYQPIVIARKPDINQKSSR